MICPNCNYERKPTDLAPEWQCPSCSVAYNKVGPNRTVSSPSPQKPPAKPFVLYLKDFLIGFFSVCKKITAGLFKTLKDIRFNSNQKKNKVLTCKQCGDEMLKTTRGQGNLVGITKALIVFFVGIFILIAFFWTLIGIVIGIVFIIMSLGMGGGKQQIWKCKGCGYFFEI